MTRDHREPGAKPRLNVKQHLDKSRVDVTKGRSHLESALQYLLSEDEYNNLKARAVDSADYEKLRIAADVLRGEVLCKHDVACVYDKTTRKSRRLLYCDDCPIQRLVKDLGIRKAMCPLEWEFSQ